MSSAQSFYLFSKIFTSSVFMPCLFRYFLGRKEQFYTLRIHISILWSWLISKEDIALMLQIGGGMFFVFFFFVVFQRFVKHTSYFSSTKSNNRSRSRPDLWLAGADRKKESKKVVNFMIWFINYSFQQSVQNSSLKIQNILALTNYQIPLLMVQ